MVSMQTLLNSLVTIPGKFAEGAELNLKTAAATLDVPPRSVRMMLESGVLPDLKSARVIEMSKRGVLVSSGGKQPILRTGVSSIDEETNRRIGYSADMSDSEVVEGNRQWWRADPDRIIAAYYLPVSIGGFNAALLGIDGLEESVRVDVADKNGKPGKEVRHSFQAHLIARYDGKTGQIVMAQDNPPVEDGVYAHAVLGRFQRSVSGGPIAYL